MRQLFACFLIVYGIGFVGLGEAPAATIKGTAFDLASPPQPRRNRVVPIIVTGIGIDAAGQPITIPLPQSTLRSDGTYEVVIDNANVRAVSLFFQGSNDGLQDVLLDRLLNQNQTVNNSLPDAEQANPCAVVPCRAYPVQSACTRRRLFRR
jgi:hypothetical protein